METTVQIQSILANSNKQSLVDHYIEMAAVIHNTTPQAFIDKEVAKAKLNMQKQAARTYYHHDLEEEIGKLMDAMI